jgi:hypothetical protein
VAFSSLNATAGQSVAPGRRHGEPMPVRHEARGRCRRGGGGCGRQPEAGPGRGPSSVIAGLSRQDDRDVQATVTVTVTGTAVTVH